MVKETRLGADDISLETYRSVANVTANDVLHGVSTVLEHFITAAKTHSPSMFDSPIQSDLPIRSFLKHIMNSGLCSKECFVIALIYAERLLQRQTSLTISRVNAERLMLISVMVASKVLDDMYCRNMYYACAGGMTNKDLNRLELQYCFMLDFDLNVNPTEYAVYCSTLSRKPEKVPKSQPLFWPTSPQQQPAWTMSIFPPKYTTPKPRDGMVFTPSKPQTPVTAVPIPMAVPVLHPSAARLPFPVVPQQQVGVPMSSVKLPQQPFPVAPYLFNSSTAAPMAPQQGLQKTPWSPAWSITSSRPESPWSHSSEEACPWTTSTDPLGAASAWFNAPRQDPSWCASVHTIQLV